MCHFLKSLRQKTETKMNVFGGLKGGVSRISLKSFFLIFLCSSIPFGKCFAGGLAVNNSGDIRRNVWAPIGQQYEYTTDGKTWTKAASREAAEEAVKKAQSTGSYVAPKVKDVISPEGTAAYTTDEGKTWKTVGTREVAEKAVEKAEAEKAKADARTAAEKAEREAKEKEAQLLEKEKRDAEAQARAEAEKAQKDAAEKVERERAMTPIPLPLRRIAIIGPAKDIVIILTRNSTENTSSFKAIVLLFIYTMKEEMIT